MSRDLGDMRGPVSIVPDARKPQSRIVTKIESGYPFARLALLIRPFERALFPRRVGERLLRRAAIEMSRSVKDCRRGEN